MSAHDEIQMEATVMVGAGSSRNSQEAISCHQAQDRGSRRAVSGATDGAAPAQLVWLNKAVPDHPYEFRGGGNVFDRL